MLYLYIYLRETKLFNNLNLKQFKKQLLKLQMLLFLVKKTSHILFRFMNIPHI